MSTLLVDSDSLGTILALFNVENLRADAGSLQFRVRGKDVEVKIARLDVNAQVRTHGIAFDVGGIQLTQQGLELNFSIR